MHKSDGVQRKPTPEFAVSFTAAPIPRLERMAAKVEEKSNGNR